MTNNPYIISNWVEGANFYGRDELCAQIAHGPDRCIYLMGLRRIGKTSLLRRVRDLLAPHAIYCDLMQAAAADEGLDEARLIRLLRRELVRQAANSAALSATRSLWEREGAQLCPWLEELGWAWEEQQITVTLLWDEGEMLRRLPVSTLMCLRALLQHGAGLRLVVAASKGLAALNERWPDAGSPFLFGFRHLAIGVLSADEAAALIQQRGQVAADIALVSAIDEASGRHPFLVQVLCDRLYRAGQLRRPEMGDLNVDEQLAELFRIDVAQLSPGERALLMALAGSLRLNSAELRHACGLDSTTLHSFVQSLTQIGYLRNDDHYYRIGNALLAQWLRSNPPPAVGISDQASLTALPGPVDGSDPGLSEREVAVLRLLAVGLRNSEIGERLFVSENTIKAHLKNIYRKLGVGDRVQALNRARTLRLF
ncbi:response regulator transcription factor [Candidatus Gracilibacteria bacterium]|nr:response regulator transcription factor [Candidatus Gracilibacteria bacterium]